MSPQVAEDVLEHFCLYICILSGAPAYVPLLKCLVLFAPCHCSLPLYSEIKMYNVQSCHLWPLLLSFVSCWHSETGSRIHPTHLRPPALPRDPTVTHSVVTHHNWQRHKVRASTAATSSPKPILSIWHLPPRPLCTVEGSTNDTFTPRGNKKNVIQSEEKSYK